MTREEKLADLRRSAQLATEAATLAPEAFEALHRSELWDDWADVVPERFLHECIEIQLDALAPRCGLNADWSCNAWWFGPGAINREFPGVCIVDAEDDSYEALIVTDDDGDRDFTTIAVADLRDDIGNLITVAQSAAKELGR